MTALKQAGTTVYEPMHRFRLGLTAGMLGPALPVLVRLRAVLWTPVAQRVCHACWRVRFRRLRSMSCNNSSRRSRGEGVVETAFDSYQAVVGTVPDSPPTDLNPLNRKEYLLHTVRRIAGQGDSRWPARPWG
ncbi:hypothetical protein [Streptomyces sp. NBC_00842]|uniref:hypothetical protein n=1 Tax=Streptomyces sp. NBC_00842 TaxID=2975848 RepID=UPI00386338D7